MEESKLHLMKDVVIDYYVKGLRQNQIAKKYCMSTSMVSRMIDEAKNQGFVKFQFDFPNQSDERLSEELKKKFRLRNAFVASSTNQGLDVVFDDLAAGLSDYLINSIRNGMKIGISWGKTMYQISNRIKLKQVYDDLEVYQLHGGVSNYFVDTKSVEITRNFGNALHAEWYTLSTPSIVDNSKSAEAFYQDSSVSSIVKQYEKLGISIFSVGTMSPSELGVRAGYFTAEEFEKLKNQGYIGDICSRYFKREGKYRDNQLYKRTMGINLGQLKEIPIKICIAINPQKTEIIQNAILAGYINVLFVDNRTALSLLKE